MAEALPTLGDTTFDVYLNGEAFWGNIPAAVWRYKLGGYRVLKKWLSYREQRVLGRRLRAEEIQHFADTARRIAALLIVSSPAPGRRFRQRLRTTAWLFVPGGNDSQSAANGSGA